jgi:hypothetical protein
MIKNIFEVNNEEKSRILNLHENATKRQYLFEQSFTPKSSDIGVFVKNCYIDSYRKNKSSELFKNAKNISKRLEKYRTEFAANENNPPDGFFESIGKQVQSIKGLLDELLVYAKENKISTVGID